MGEPQLATTTLTETACCVCGVAFAVPSNLIKNRIERGSEFFCPNGHSLSYGESKVERLERELRAAASKLWQANNELNHEKIKREKLERRIQRGVCPYCKRTFKNVARHMECKHK